MASFIGGEALARVVYAEYLNNTPAGSLSIHTVPAGRYAKVFIQANNTYSSSLREGNTGQAIFNPSAVPVEVANPNVANLGYAAAFSNYFPDGAYFNEGDIIQLASLAVNSTVKVIILEYNKPDTLNLP